MRRAIRLLRVLAKPSPPTDGLWWAALVATLSMRWPKDSMGTCGNETMRRFCLVRNEDVSGVSGTGVVAEGVVFSTGKVVLSWCSEYRSVTVYDTLADLETVHGHAGRTCIAWLDPADGCGGQH
jgi:hypothetical protein